MILEEKKHEVWDHALTLPRPHGITQQRLDRIKNIVWTDQQFWQDVIIRHGLDKETPKQLLERDSFTYDHCFGNFWAMIRHRII
jgi:hypothetical protein